jgi:sugar phosphate isomerase/epimerase
MRRPPRRVADVIDEESVVLSHCSLRYAGLEERFAAAQAAGFHAIGLSVDAFLASEEAGVTPRQQRQLAEHYDVVVEEIEVLRPWWREAGERARSELAETTAFRMADTFGSRYVQAIGPYHGTLDDAAETFAAVCDRAAEHGLTVGIEFLPYTNISDALIAGSLVAAADRPNGGVCVDSWHHFRGAADDAQIRELTAARVAGVQLDDGLLLPEHPDYLTDCVENRRVPGEGEFDLAGFIRLLDEMDVSVPVSLEVISTELQALPAAEVTRQLREGFCRVLVEARR